MQHGARVVLRWFSALYVLLIVVQVFLAGEGVFRMGNIKHDCTKSTLGAHCLAGSKTLNAHRVLGDILAGPGAILFLIIALLAWHPNKRIRTITIAAPVLLFLQIVWAGVGGWVGGIHVLFAFVVLAMYGFLARTLRDEKATLPASQPEAAPASP
jgi:hypothetical protein